MSSPSPTKTRLLLCAAVAVVVGMGALFAPGEKPATPAAPPVTAPAATSLTKEQAMTALMSLPELAAWSAQLEKGSGGSVRGALMEYDQQQKVINGKRYWQLSFVENGSEAAHRWESFLVASDGEILVEDLAADKPMTLAEWRRNKKPLDRIAP